MRISPACAACLYDKQKHKTDNEEYLKEVRNIIDNRKESDTSPYLVWLFGKVHEKYFGAPADYSDIKKQYNDLVLSMEEALREEIEQSEDPLAASLVMAGIGNYIDFGAMNHVDKDEFLSLFAEKEMREDDQKTYASFLAECEKGRNFLLICDNCGEIVLDRLFIEQLKKRFPHLSVKALVRGREVLNDATPEDARYTGLDKVAEVFDNGEAMAGTVYEMMPDESKKALDGADIILAKGQGNYETLSGQGWHLFFSFLCKCDLFTGRFGVPRLTRMFVEEK